MPTIEKYRTINGVSSEWVKNVLILGDPITTLYNDPVFLPAVAQLYQAGDPDVKESLTVWYPELKPIVEDYIKYLQKNGDPAKYQIPAISKTTTKSFKDYLPWILGGTAAVLLIFMMVNNKK